MASLSPAPATTRQALEELLRARRLQAELPPLRGVPPQRVRLPTGIGALDSLLGGGLPRGQLSEVHGPASSGRTGVLLGLLARTTRAGALCAWVDPGDRFDPATAAEAGADLERLLWLRGATPRGLPAVLAAVGTLVGSGLFELVVLDLLGVPPGDVRRLPAQSYVRLQRLVEPGATALVLLAGTHTAASPGGVSLALERQCARFSGQPGPGRLLRGLRCLATAGRHVPQHATFDLHAL